MKGFIVKVQISQFSNDSKVRMLIYNEDRSIFFETEEPEDGILQIMDGRPKIYCDAHLEGTNVVLDKETSWQDW